MNRKTPNRAIRKTKYLLISQNLPYAVFTQGAIFQKLLKSPSVLQRISHHLASQSIHLAVA